ncbi:MAG: peptide chain release factor N(5)-glutamine methyltransferase [Parachlamydia sp.]|nr:peptide chain release factor N(5)-glutamine methyltransferase [Parachlamydia sp.]
MTCREALLHLQSLLIAKSNSRQEAEDILSLVIGCNRSDLYLQGDRELESSLFETALQYAERRIAGEPLAYIHGRVEFYGCHITVNSSVLIPRPETEVLVDHIVQVLKKDRTEGKVLLDLCCGSGCIGIALKKKFPSLIVLLSDVSAEALKIASKNATINQADVEFLCGDLLAPLAGRKVDYCVCNPPYVTEAEYEVLDVEVKEFEPRLALVGGKDGLEFYRRLASGLGGCLSRSGKAWLEIGYTQGNELEKLFTFPPWKKTCLKNDWAGHHRFFFLENE